MKKSILILLIIIGPGIKVQNISPFNKLQKYLDSAVEENLSGTMVYVKCPKRGTWIGAAGFSDKEQNKLIEPSDVLALASVSKVYVAVAVFKLIEEGSLALNDKISNYLPNDIVTNLPNGDLITIRQLLNHTSGLFNYEYDTTLNKLYLNDQLSLDTLSHLESLERYVYGKDAFDMPGEEHHYSSTGYMLLAMIMDRIVPDGHTAYVRSMIDEMAMTSTFYRETPPHHNVRYYGDLNQDGIQEDISDKVFETTNWFIGDDGVYATIEEVGIFMEKLIKVEILGPIALKQMLTWNKEKDPDYGQGVFPDKSFPYKLTIGHSGRGIGSTTDVYYFPIQEITIAIVSNTGLRAAAPKFRKSYLKMRNRIIKKVFLF